MYQLFRNFDINPQDRQALLARFGIPDAPLFAQGTEAEVYELSNNRLLKLYSTEHRRGFGFLKNFPMYSSDFALPKILDVIAQNQCTAVIETRVPGVPLADVLPTLPDSEHERIESLYLDSVWKIRNLTPANMPDTHNYLFFSDGSGIADTFGRFYTDALKQQLAKVSAIFTGNYANFPQHSHALLAGLRTIEKPLSVVHGDLFEGNIMVDETATKIMGVIDFGVFSLIRGHYLLDVAGAYSYYRMFDPDRKAIRARLLAKILARLTDDERPVFFQFLLGNAIMTCDLYAGEHPLLDDGHFNWALEIVSNENYWQNALK